MWVEFDGGTNALRVTPDGGHGGVVVQRDVVAGVVDVAEGGRLAGIEVAGLAGVNLAAWPSDDSVSVADDGSAYLVLSEGDDRNVRSVAVAVGVELGGSGELLAVAIPRRGKGYEISYPSGNQ